MGKTACQLFDEKLVDLTKLRKRTDGRKMDEKLRKQLDELEKKVRAAKVACTVEKLPAEHVTQINKDMQHFTYKSIGGVRDGIVDAAVKFSSYATQKKPANAGFVLVVPDAAVNAVRALFLESSPAAVIVGRLTGGANNPLMKSLDPKGDVEKMLATLMVNMNDLSKQIFFAFENFGRTLQTKHTEVWVDIADQWTRSDVRQFEKDSLKRFESVLEKFYPTTGIPRPNKNYGLDVHGAMAAEFNQWKQNGEPATMEKVKYVGQEKTGRDPEQLKEQMRANKGQINEKIDLFVNDRIGFVRNNLQDVGTKFEAWVLARSDKPNTAGFVADVLAAAATMMALFPPATIAATIVKGTIIVAKGPLTDGLDPKKDAASMATKVKDNLATTSIRLGEAFAKFGERLFKEDPKLWYQIGLAAMMPPSEPDPDDPDPEFPKGVAPGWPEETEKLLYDKAGVPRKSQNFAKPLLKKLMASYLRWELKERTSLVADPDTIKKVIDDRLIDKEAEEEANKSLGKEEKAGKK